MAPNADMNAVSGALHSGWLPIADAARRADGRDAGARNGIAFAIQSSRTGSRGGKDPIQFRIDPLSTTPIPLPPPPPPAPGAPAGRGGGRGGAGGGGFNPARARGVLELVREKSGWGKGTLPKGTGRGVAFHFSHQGYFATVVEVQVDASNRIKVTKVWSAGDVGSQIINPGNALQQVQGSVIEGSATRWAGRSIDGARGGDNFHQYPAARAADAAGIGAFLEATITTGLGDPALP
jgi:isoquinoline 1-oxidoreductase beta subunit